MLEKKHVLGRYETPTNRKIHQRHSMHISYRMHSLIGKHLVDAADLIAGGNDEGDHGRAISSGRLQILDELLHLEDLDLWCSWL